MKSVFSVCAVAALAFACSSAAQAAPQRLLKLDDLDQLHDVNDPEISPAGDWVAYTVRTVNVKADKHETHLWMTSYDGKTTVQLTSRPKENENHPRWSPDGRWLAFLSGRTDDKKNDQLWLLDRLGGEAQKITDFKGGVVDFAWAPDGKRIALIVIDEDKDAPSADDNDKTPKPIVIDRFQFMQDIGGYIRHLHDHLYLFDVASRKADIFTPGEFDEALPAWSPDGKSIAFVSKRHKDVDRNDEWDVYVMAAAKGAMPHAITTYPGANIPPTAPISAAIPSGPRMEDRLPICRAVTPS